MRCGTLDLARLCDALSHTRNWVAEHHCRPMLASAAPEMMIGAIGTATEGDPGRQRRRDGPRYPPLKIAEVFTVCQRCIRGVSIWGSAAHPAPIR